MRNRNSLSEWCVNVMLYSRWSTLHIPWNPPVSTQTERHFVSRSNNYCLFYIRNRNSLNEWCVNVMLYYFQDGQHYTFLETLLSPLKLNGGNVTLLVTNGLSVKLDQGFLTHSQTVSPMIYGLSSLSFTFPWVRTVSYRVRWPPSYLLNLPRSYSS